MKSFSVTIGLSLVGLALSDPLACGGHACMVENDQAAMLQSSLLHKGEASGAIAGEDKESRGEFCKDVRDYKCYPKTGFPACCTDGLKKTCGSVKPPCDKKMKKKGKGKGKGKGNGKGRSGRWGREVDHTYCTGSYDGKDSKRSAMSACKRDGACGGVYQPGNDPGKWFLCKGFDTFASTSNSIVIEKLGGSSPSPSPSPSPSYDTRRRNRPSSSSCWGREVSGYCSGSYGNGNSKSQAESQCMNTADCGGIYEPGTESGQWYLCKDFNVYTSTSGSHSIRKECDTSPSPSPSYDDDRGQRDPSPSPSSSYGDSTCQPCGYWDCRSNQCASQNPFMCTGGSAKGGCNSGSSYWGSTSACTACCDTSYC